MVHNFDEAAAPDTFHHVERKNLRSNNNLQFRWRNRNNFDNFNISLNPNIKALRTFDGLLNLTIGIVNGTFPMEATQLDACKSSIDKEFRIGSNELLKTVDD